MAKAKRVDTLSPYKPSEIRCHRLGRKYRYALSRLDPNFTIEDLAMSEKHPIAPLKLILVVFLVCTKSEQRGCAWLEA